MPGKNVFFEVNQDVNSIKGTINGFLDIILTKVNNKNMQEFYKIYLVLTKTVCFCAAHWSSEKLAIVFIKTRASVG